jgi:predicted nuclease of predicted toxin-antitoxin system
MRLLLDENLSFRLVRALEDIYPGTAHVREMGRRFVEDPTATFLPLSRP